MSRPRPVAFSVCLLAATLVLAWLALPRGGQASSTIPPAANNQPSPTPDEAAEARASEAYGKLPISFVANEGQADERVKFISRGGGYSLSLTPTEAVLVLAAGRAADAGEDDDSTRKPGHAQAHVLVMRMAGANPSPRLSGLDELPGKVNYLLGSDPTRWRTNVPTYSRVKYESVYDGVDLVYYGNPQKLEYDFLVSPGTDPRVIRLEFEGMEGLALNERGDLVLRTAGGEMSLNRPVAYQEADGRRVTVESRYVIKGGREVGFEVGDYDRNSPLVIDPVLVYSTYLGGNNNDQGLAIAVNSAGNAFVAGTTWSANFPVTGSSLQPTLKGTAVDVFVTKLNAAGSAVVYSTYLGGTGVDQGLGLAVNASGQAHVTGSTNSEDFPVANALRPATGGATDAFVAKLNATGSALVYSTYLGGLGHDFGAAVALDGGGNVYVTGDTNSKDFPVANAFSTEKKGAALFKTTDGAASWQPGDAGLGGSGIADLVLDPKNPSVLYAATEAGVYKSTDAGANWAGAGLGQTPRPIYGLAVNPVNTSIVYATTDNGVFKSTNGGNTWAATGLGAGNATRSIVINPSAPNTVYAASFTLVHKSTDGGVSWSAIPVSYSSTVLSLAIDPSAPANVYAGTTGGLFKSANSGSTWSEVNLGDYYYWLAVDALVFDKMSPATLFASTSAGVFKSTDGGSTWVNTNPAGTVPRLAVLALDPTNSSTMYGGLRSGHIYKTTDGGANWSLIENYPLQRLNVLRLDPTNSAKIYVGGVAGPDAFVAKLNAAGSALVYSTYLGGAYYDSGAGIAVGADGSAHVAGATYSSNFPVANALQPAKGDAFAGASDAFLTKLSPSGSALTYSTYLGGDNHEFARGVALDGSGNAYVVGATSSLNFPVTPGGFQTTHTGPAGPYDAFITKVNPTGSALVYSTLLGGDFNDQANGVAVNSAGAAFVTGYTGSENFPVTSDGYVTPSYSAFSAFVTQLSPAGSSLVYSILAGGGNTDEGRAIAIDSVGGVYVAGNTDSSDFPVLNAKQAASGGYTDAFVLKLRPAADLVVTMTDAPDPLILGKNLTYTVNVKNVGDLPATNVTLQDTLPAGATFVSVTTSRGTCSGTSAVTCNLGDMAPGASAVVKLVVTPPAVKTLSNTASAACAEAETTLANNSATQTTEVIFADLSIMGSAPYNKVAPGSQINYLFTVTNKSETQAQSVKVTAPLPAGTTFVSCGAVGGTCGSTGSGRTITFSTLAPGQSVTIILAAKVNADVAEGTTLTNTATVSAATSDPVAANNSATVVVTATATPLRKKTNGKIAFGSWEDLYTVKSNGTEPPVPIPNIPQGARFPSWSPDGTRLAYTIGKATNQYPYSYVAIEVVKADGTGLVTIAEDAAEDNPERSNKASWSPDGSRIAYMGDDYYIHLANADGTGSARLPKSPSFADDLDWSPDGTRFLYSKGGAIFVVNVDGTGLTRLIGPPPGTDYVPVQNRQASWSPDMKRVLFVQQSNGDSQVFIMNSDGTGARRLLNYLGTTAPEWSPDGTKLSFYNGTSVRAMNLDGLGDIELTSKEPCCNLGSISWQPVPTNTPLVPPTTPPAPTFSIKGDVTRSTGGPLYLAATVTLSGTRNYTVPVGADGYLFTNLPAGGNYKVTVSSAAFNFSPTSRTFTNLQADQTGADFVGTYIPVSISGHIKDTAGNPLANLQVTAQGSYPTLKAVTDANGYYVFPNVFRGSFYRIAPPYLGPYAYTPDAVSFTNIQADQTADFVGRRLPTYTIGGRVTVKGSPATGCEGVPVYISGPGFGYYVNTDAGGYFSFGYQRSGDSYTVTIFDGGGYVYSPRSITIDRLTTHQQLSFVRYPLTQYTTISGKVADAQGNAPSSSVLMRLGGGVNAYAWTEYDGTYVLNEVPAGLNYTLTPTPTDGYYFAPSSMAINNLSTAGKVANFTATRTGLQFSTASYSVQEGAGSAVVNVKRLGETTGTVSVKYATSNSTALSGSDYTAATGTVTFAPGETLKTFNVPITDDSTDEATETLKLSLSAPAGGAGLGTLTSATLAITDNDLPPSVSINDVTVTEPGSGQTTTATFTVTLSAASGQSVTVKYASANGTAAAPSDYTARALTPLIIAPGLTSKTVSVAVKGDALTEADETFKVLLSSPTNATIADGEGTCTIKDAASSTSAQADGAKTMEAASAVEFAEAAYSAGEGDGRVELTVRRTGDLSAALAVEYETADATATDRSDYGTAVGRLSFAPGEESKSLTLIITDDSYAEGDESLRLRLSLPEGGAALGQNSEVEILLADDDRVDGATNPLDDSLFFVRQQFVDLLGREPEAEELAELVRKLNECPAGDATCGREAVSAGLLLSDEYQGRARLVYGLYKIALGREPLYREFVREMGSLVEAGQPRQYTERWLRGRGLAAVRSVKTDRDIINSLRASAGLGADDAARLVSDPELKGKTRAELLMSVIGRDEVREKLRAESLVLIHYFTFLRRDPEDEGRRAWAAAAGDVLNLVSGFINSSEYRQRFGQ